MEEILKFYLVKREGAVTRGLLLKQDIVMAVTTSRDGIPQKVSLQVLAQ